MPARTTVPPARSIAAGTTSEKSLIAEAPKITTMSLSRASEAAASATGPISCGVRRSAVNRPPERARRASVTRSVLSRTLALTPGRTVWMTPTRIGRKALTAKISPPAQIPDTASTRSAATA